MAVRFIPIVSKVPSGAWTSLHAGFKGWSWKDMSVTLKVRCVAGRCIVLGNDVIFLFYRSVPMIN